MGGDWVVVQAVPTRKLRDMMKKLLGPHVIFIVLRMSKEDQWERVKMTQGQVSDNHEMLKKASVIHEPATQYEGNAVDVLVTNNMTCQDVVQHNLQKSLISSTLQTLFIPHPAYLSSSFF